MQLGLRIHDGEKLPLPELLPLVREKGFSCGHLALSKSCKEYPYTPAALTPGYAMHIKRLFAENKLDVAVLGCYHNLANPDALTLHETLEMYTAHIRFASVLGCGVVGTETGAPNMEYAYEPACRSQRALDIFIQNLRKVVRCAEKCGVIIAIEPVYKHIVYSPERARQVLDAIASPNLQIILDPVNLLGEDNYAERETILAEAIRLLSDEIAVVHIKDFILGENGLKSVAAGKGLMDYTQLLAFMKKRKPFIHATLENTNPDNAKQSRELIQCIWNRL